VDIEGDKLIKVLKAGGLSPAAANRKERNLIVVKKMVKSERGMPAPPSTNPLSARPPVVLAACTTESRTIMTCGQPAHTVDLSIAFAYMILQTCEPGLGIYWIGAFQ
jgi:hypothetical protein